YGLAGGSWFLSPPNDWRSPGRLTVGRDGVGVRRRDDEAPPSTAHPVHRMVLPTISFIARRSAVLAGSPISSVFTISIRPADLPQRPPLGASHRRAAGRPRANAVGRRPPHTSI